MNWLSEIKSKAPELFFPVERVTKTVSVLVTSLREEVEKAGFKQVVLGLSGGIDSALSLYLAVAAFGKEAVTAVCMPYKKSSSNSLVDAEEAIKDTGVTGMTIEITPQIDAYFQRFPEASPLRQGNKMARERMTILYDLSAEKNALVIGTSNRTEILLGYGTLFGDTASAINPLGDIYKTHVRQLAEYLHVPSSILYKAPSADLWENQTDEGEFGFSYMEVDRLLHYLVDKQFSPAELFKLGFSNEFVQGVIGRIRRNQFKRQLPIILKVGTRTVGMDFRYLRDWGL